MPTSPAIRVLALAVFASSCRAPAPPAAIDPALASRVPSSAIAIAGVNLDQLRASPLYAKLPPAASAFLEPFRGAHSLLIASTGAELLTIARGVVTGATQTAPDVALLGSPSLIAAATASHPASATLAAAETVAAGHPIWIAVRGGSPLPLEGNLANANNLVTLAESLTLSLSLRDAVGLELTARCPSPAAAAEFERRLRALLSLTTAANARQPEIAALLRSVQLRREEGTVHASLSTPPDALGKLLP
ncbi:MAG TPA: hypothetical protein VGF49_10300 [Candidatus Solibacter sp.]